MEGEIEVADALNLKCQISDPTITWKHEFEHHRSQVDMLHEKLIEVKAGIQYSDDDAKELALLWRRVKANTILLSYIKSKARIMAVPHLALDSCGIKQQNGVGYIDRHGIPLSGWSRDVDLSPFESADDDFLSVNRSLVESLEDNDGAYISEQLKSVQMVSDVMESLVKKAIMAESETAVEKEKVSLGKEEIKQKTLKIENMYVKVEAMKKFALGTNDTLNEMRQKVEDMVLETSRQRQVAAENEEELSRVKQNFEALRSYVSSLISVRETLLSSEKQFQTMEKLFERLLIRTTHLENEKMQKEAEIQKLLEENVKLSSLLDHKEAQLLAMSEQCKFLALNNQYN